MGLFTAHKEMKNEATRRTRERGGEGGGITEHYERRLFSEETMAKTDAGVDGVWELLEKKGKKTANQKGKAEK